MTRKPRPRGKAVPSYSNGSARDSRVPRVPARVLPRPPATAQRVGGAESSGPAEADGMGQPCHQRQLVTQEVKVLSICTASASLLEKPQRERRNPSLQGPGPGKHTYFKFQLLLGARAGFARLLPPLLVAAGQPVCLLGRQGHCGEGKGDSVRRVPSWASGPPPPLGLCSGDPAPSRPAPALKSRSLCSLASEGGPPAQVLPCQSLR